MPEPTGESASIPVPPARRFRPPSTGQVIRLGWNTYTIGTHLGKGAFGTTFECSDLWNNEIVAKVIVPNGKTYEQIRQNWEHELRNLLLLRHPNITFVFDAFEHEDTFYIIIERCGGTLQDLFGLPDYDGGVWFLPVARCILQGLHFIHMNGYVHKDCHIGNIFWSLVRNELTPASGPRSVTFKIGDLGISRIEADIDPLTTTLADWILPPERLDPTNFGLLGKQVDVYHASLLLLSVLKGAPLSFTREQVLEGAPRKAAEALGPPFGPALARALRRHVADRTTTAFDLWQELVAGVSPSPSLAEEP